MQQQILVDVHVHTVASGHAYSTINEVAQAASERGLQGVAMTDHGPALPGGPHAYHFMALRFLPREIAGVRVYSGVEANILAPGKLDLPLEALDRLDVVLAGFHDDCGYEGVSAQEHTQALLEVMHLPQVNIISHPGNPRFPVDYAAVVAEAKATGTALEINSSSFRRSRLGSSSNCLELARLCKEQGAPVAIGSDAHIAQDVGQFTDALDALQQVGLPLNQVVNQDLASVEAFLHRHG